MVEIGWKKEEKETIYWAARKKVMDPSKSFPRGGGHSVAGGPWR